MAGFAAIYLVPALLVLFAAFRTSHDVAQPGPRTKIFQHRLLGNLRMLTSSFLLTGVPETRMIVYTPNDAHTAEALPRLAELVRTG